MGLFPKSGMKPEHLEARDQRLTIHGSYVLALNLESQQFHIGTGLPGHNENMFANLEP